MLTTGERHMRARSSESRVEKQTSVERRMAVWSEWSHYCTIVLYGLHGCIHGVVGHCKKWNLSICIKELIWRADMLLRKSEQLLKSNVAPPIFSVLWYDPYSNRAIYIPSIPWKILASSHVVLSQYSFPYIFHPSIFEFGIVEIFYVASKISQPS